MNSNYRQTLRRINAYLPFLLIFIALYFSQHFSNYVSVNGVLQLLLFVGIVSIPAYITKRMSYVDIAWPLGLVLIGVLVLLLGEGYWLRKLIIGGMYLFAGLRMGLVALKWWSKGHLNKELPRYQYQRLRWTKAGFTNEDISLQYEIMVQCLCNVTLLAIPAILQAYNPQDSLSALEILGYGLWVIFIGLEHLADHQKNRFLTQAYLEKRKRQCCNVGLWKYSRHPNYFSEWMVWNTLILSSVPSLFYFYAIENIWVWAGIAMGLLFVSRAMYVTLVYYTGAKPAEYYSLQRRPEYADYQKTTNRFFPGPTK